MDTEQKKPRKSAWETALKLLAGRDYSASEMLARLARRGYTREEAEETADKLKEYGYVKETGTDREQLCAMAREYLHKKNKTRLTPSVFHSLESFLLRKGFEPDLVREYLTRLAEALNSGSAPEE